MNETIVAKGLAKHLAAKYEGYADEIRVKNKAETKAHGYTEGCATILGEGLPYNEYTDGPWTYDLDGELQDWVEAKYGKGFWLEAYSSWMLCVYRD